jgi:hypothetical protein
MAFLKSKFADRIISRRAETNWTARGPNLNVLDFLFWSFAESQVYRSNPNMIQEVKGAVEGKA